MHNFVVFRCAEVVKWAEFKLSFALFLKTFHVFATKCNNLVPLRKDLRVCSIVLTPRTQSSWRENWGRQWDAIRRITAGFSTCLQVFAIRNRYTQFCL